MLKLLKRSAQAERQVAKKAAKQSKNEFKGNLIRFRQAVTEANREMRANKKASRQASKDAWELGPLAPKRNLGIDNYDALSGGIRVDWTNMGTYKPKAAVVEKRCAWAGGVKQLCLAPKDRVVILDGPDKGKIDKIKDINLEAGYLTLETCNQVSSKLQNLAAITSH
jgi:large subunit ribosomal protein L24